MKPRRAALFVGSAALVALLAVGALNLLRPSDAPAQEEANRISSELRCPTCQALSVADSSSTAARQIRDQIGQMLAEGRTPAEVKQHFVDRYGEWILLAPSSPLPWLLPPAAVAVGGAALTFWLVRRRRPDAPRSSQERSAPAGPYRDRIREEVEALDA